MGQGSHSVDNNEARAEGLCLWETARVRQETPKRRVAPCRLLLPRGCSTFPI